MILSLSGLSKSYGALTVTNNVSLDVAAGAAVGIIGPNGAGKSTLFNLITGDVRADSGAIKFQDRRIETLPPHRRAAPSTAGASLPAQAPARSSRSTCPSGRSSG